MKITQRVFRLNLGLGAAAAVIVLSAFFGLIFEERFERNFLSSTQALTFDLLETRSSLKTVEDTLGLVTNSDLSARFLLRDPEVRESAIYQLLLAILQNNPNFVQARLLDDQGFEVLRIDREGDELVLKPEDQLQDKSSRDYIQSAASLPPGSHFYSRITLNEEHGQIEQPEWSALRGVAVLGNAQGKRIGYFVVNVRMDDILKKLASSPFSADAIVFDETGRYLYHSDPLKAFSPQRGGSASLMLDDPESFMQVRSLAASEDEFDVAKSSDESIVFGYFSLPADDGAQSIYVLRKLDKPLLVREVLASLVDSVWIALLVLGAIWGVGWITANYLKRRFLLLDRMVAYFQEGDFSRGYSLITESQLSEDEISESGKAFAKLVEDITKASDELELANNKMQRVFNSISSAIIVADAQGDIVDCNAATGAIFGYIPSELIGTNVKFLMPSRIAEKHNGYMNASQLGQGSRTLGVVRELMAVRNGGEHFPIDLNLSQVETSAGSMFVAVVTDLSSIKKSQSDLARYAEELRQRNLDLQKYAYALSHDLKSPIRKITLFSQMIDRKTLSEEDLHHIERIESAGQKASVMIDALMSLANVESSAAEFKDCDLEAIAREAVNQARDNYPDTDIDVVYRDLPNVKCDPNLIGNVFVNLTVNALKYGQSEGKLDLRIYSVEEWPRVAKANSGQVSGICVLVEDQGPGIAEGDQEAVFDIFYRAKRELKDVEGSGVGLSTCRKIMEVHGGSIRIDPDYHDGARFILIFPGES